MSSKAKFVNMVLVVMLGIGVAADICGQSSSTAKGKGKPVAKKLDPKAAPKETPSSAGALSDTPEADAIIPYYTNYLKEYRLGPNDVISVEVFGQCPDYCKSGITVPPTARISYPLVRDGVMVGGKTVEQVAAEITRKLDEYIIDPKVTVTLEKAMSARYSVLGKVVSPGVRVLDRKVSVYEAVVESGGVAKDGDMKKVTIYSYNGTGKITSQMVNLAEIQRGHAEMVFLKPGDQVFVSGKGFSLEKVFEILSKVSMARYLVGSPF
jgi:polysaccharide biosynthesis/export protein